MKGGKYDGGREQGRSEGEKEGIHSAHSLKYQSTTGISSPFQYHEHVNE